MGRDTRIDIEGGWYHVMNRGVARQETFLSDADRVEFGRLLGVGHDRWGVNIHAYCLMPNHYHLLLECPDAGLSNFMHGVASVFVRHVNDRVGRDGSLFRGRFHSIPVRDDRQLLATVRYIHRNALDVTGVTAVDEYRWSSHRTYLGHRRQPLWLRTDMVMTMFGGDIDEFHQFVLTDLCGTDRPTHSVDLVGLTAIVDLVMEELADSIRGATQSVARTVLLLVADELGGSPAAEAILGSLEYSTPATESAATRRARQRARADPGLRCLVDRVLELVVHDVPGTS